MEQSVGGKFNIRCAVRSLTFTEAIYRATEENVLRDVRRVNPYPDSVENRVSS
jgi:hypothetical protein